MIVFFTIMRGFADLASENEVNFPILGGMLLIPLRSCSLRH